MSISQDYLDTLLRYYEEEISGEAYFYGLVDAFDESGKVTLLARMERSAAQAIEPLLEKYALGPVNEKQLKDLGESEVSRHQGLSWHQFITHIAERYPLYLDEFYALEAMAPAEDLPLLQRLTEHEIVVIEFAERELSGRPDSIEPLEKYLGAARRRGDQKGQCQLILLRFIHPFDCSLDCTDPRRASDRSGLSRVCRRQQFLIDLSYCPRKSSTRLSAATSPA